MKMKEKETQAPVAEATRPRWVQGVQDLLINDVVPAEDDRARVATAMTRILPPGLSEEQQVTLARVEGLADLIVSNAGSLRDQVLSGILHHAQVQEALKTWVPLERMVEDAEVSEDVRIHFLEANKDDVFNDFAESGWNVEDTELYRILVREGFGTVNGDPVLAAGLSFPFGPGAADIKLMDGLARLGQEGLLVFLGSPTPDFFGVDRFDQLPLKKSLLQGTLQRTELAAYNAFRQAKHSRYFSLFFPEVAVREPFHPKDWPAAGLEDFTEVVASAADITRVGAHTAGLQNIARSMSRYNWPSCICGLNYGGMIDGLVQRTVGGGAGPGLQVSPVEVPIDDLLEMVLQNAGLVPVRPIKNQNRAVIFEAATLQKALLGLDSKLNNSARLAGKLPVVLVEAHFGHYLREAFLQLIGSGLTPKEVEMHLQKWANQYCCDSDGPVPEETRAMRPFKSITISVRPSLEDPGRLEADVDLVPAFRVAAVTARLIIRAPEEEGDG